MTQIAEQISGTILLVEDSQMDVVLTQRCFEEVAPKVDLHHVENGIEAMAFLRRQRQYADAPQPDLVLLDLNMPMMDGREVLAEIVRDEALRHLCVIILTNSSFDEDVKYTCTLRANSYVRKPIDYEQFLEAVKIIVEYWLGLVVLPSAE